MTNPPSRSECLHPPEHRQGSLCRRCLCDIRWPGVYPPLRPPSPPLRAIVLHEDPDAEFWRQEEARWRLEVWRDG